MNDVKPPQWRDGFGCVEMTDIRQGLYSAGIVAAVCVIFVALWGLATGLVFGFGWMFLVVAR